MRHMHIQHTFLKIANSFVYRKDTDSLTTFEFSTPPLSQDTLAVEIVCKFCKSKKLS